MNEAVHQVDVVAIMAWLVLIATHKCRFSEWLSIVFEEAEGHRGWATVLIGLLRLQWLELFLVEQTFHVIDWCMWLLL